MNTVGDAQTADDDTPKSRLPDDVLLVLPVRDLVLLLGAVTQIALGREVSIAVASLAHKA